MPQNLDCQLTLQRHQIVDQIVAILERRVASWQRELAERAGSGSLSSPGCLYSTQWTGMNSGEKAGRGNLFSGAYGAHRNPRAHRELKSEHAEQLREFLLLNHLYHLEKEAEVQ